MVQPSMGTMIKPFFDFSKRTCAYGSKRVSCRLLEDVCNCIDFEGSRIQKEVDIELVWHVIIESEEASGTVA